MAKDSLDQTDAACSEETFEARLARALMVGRARIKIADTIDATTLATALERQRQGKDIGPQLDILTRNHQLRATAFERLETFGFSIAPRT